MNKKSQVLIISLWILAILTLLAIGIGHRVAMSLRMSRYQKDSLKAFYLARAGLNLAVSEIEKDATANYDSLNDRWANNAELFQRIALTEDASAFASVSYTIPDEFSQPTTVFGAMDEERKININNAPAVLLNALLGESGVNSASDLVNNILIWRGDAQDKNKVYEGLGYELKAAPFANTEEMMLVKDMTTEDLQKMRNLITAYGDKVNINTASQKILKIIFYSQVSLLNSQGVAVTAAEADSLVEKILAYRNTPANVFSDILKVSENIGLQQDSNEKKIFDQALSNNLIGVESKFIRIEARGRVGSVIKRAAAVYERTSKKTVWRHEF